MCPYSDHLPLILYPRVLQRFLRRKRFLFDNMWLREDKCREIVAQSWSRSAGRDTLFRIESCAEDIWRWGRNYNKDFQRKIKNCKARLEYSCVEKELPSLLEQQHIYWKQRAKEHWYKGGDVNSKYFHNSVKSRRRKNRIHKLINDDGRWVETEDEVGNVILDYFGKLFTSECGDMHEVIDAIAQMVTPQDNEQLTRVVSMDEVRTAVFQMHPDKSPGPDGFGPAAKHDPSPVRIDASSGELPTATSTATMEPYLPLPCLVDGNEPGRDGGGDPSSELRLPLVSQPSTIRLPFELTQAVVSSQRQRQRRRWNPIFLFLAWSTATSQAETAVETPAASFGYLSSRRSNRASSRSFLRPRLRQHRCCVTEKIRSPKPPAGSTTAARNGPHQRRLRVRHPTPPWLSKLCPRPSCPLIQVPFFAARARSYYHRSPTPTAIAANHDRSSFAV
nr:uncharacterized protein LOC109158536 [Ipomoea trifida]